MEWESGGRPFPPQQSPEQPRCPYRQSSDGGNGFQFPNSQSHGFNPSMAYNPSQAPPQGLWGSVTQQNLPNQEEMNNRFLPVHAGSDAAGRAPEMSSFGYQIGLDGPSLPSSQARPPRFEANRSLQRHSYQLGMPTMAGNGQDLVSGSNQAPPAAVDSTARLPTGRRHTSGGTGLHDNGSLDVHSSPSRHLPPPHSAYHSFFLQHAAPPMPYPRQPRFSADSSGSNGSQNNPSSTHLHPPPYPRDISWTRVEFDLQHPPPYRNWFHEAFYSAQMNDADSDDDSMDHSSEGQEENVRRHGRFDQGANVHPLQEPIRQSPASRRSHTLDAEAYELQAERARAARRAQAAAVKFVASDAALKSLEKVEVSTLTGDDLNCIICYNEFSVTNPDGFVESPVRLPKCKHVFGDRCLKQWLLDSDSCPYCRDKLPSEPKRSHAGDDTRRSIAHHRVYGLEPWFTHDNSRGQADAADILEREQQYQQFIHQRLGRREDGIGGGADEILARIRRREDDLHWGTSFNQTFNGLPSRSIPDYDGRRRFRSRHTTNRTSGQAAGRTNGPNSARSNRNSSYQSGPMRTPVHNSNSSYDENGTSQRRSVTPHPTVAGTSTWTIAGTSTWSSPPQVQSTTSGRPSSLPTERSPIGEAREVRSDATVPRSPSGLNTISPPQLERLWPDNNITSGSLFNNWMAATTGNGRPVSATFVNEMPHTRLQHLHPHYISNSTEAEFAPQHRRI